MQLAAPSPSLALNLTLFNPPAGAGGLGRHVATSGPYSDAIAGVVIETRALQPGRYLPVPSTYKAGAEAARTARCADPLDQKDQKVLGRGPAVDCPQPLYYAAEPKPAAQVPRA